MAALVHVGREGDGYFKACLVFLWHMKFGLQQERHRQQSILRWASGNTFVTTGSIGDNPVAHGKFPWCIAASLQQSVTAWLPNILHQIQSVSYYLLQSSILRGHAFTQCSKIGLTRRSNSPLPRITWSLTHGQINQICNTDSVLEQLNSRGSNKANEIGGGWWWRQPVQST